MSIFQTVTIVINEMTLMSFLLYNFIRSYIMLYEILLYQVQILLYQVQILLYQVQILLYQVHFYFVLMFFTVNILISLSLL